MVGGVRPVPQEGPAPAVGVLRRYDHPEPDLEPPCPSG